MSLTVKRRVWPGRSYPMVARFDGFGTNFAVFSAVAERVELCLFDPDETRIELHYGIGQNYPGSGRRDAACAAFTDRRSPAGNVR